MRVPIARILLAACAASCSVFDPDPLPPHGETLVLVDTDLPVPRVVSRLRIDVLSADGTWIAHRDDVRPDPRDWPVSFSVYNDDESRERRVRVRLRAYADGRTVPYRGEDRLASGPTPELEPDPALAVERTVELRLVHGIRGRVRVLLRGECVGRTACAGDGEPALEPTLGRDVPSAVGSFGAQPCERPAPEGRVCVPGGAFVLGDAFYRPSNASPSPARPERVIRISRFEMDRDEVSVGRYRAAVARGFASGAPPTANETDGPLEGNFADACTWSESPRGRESYPLSCVSWTAASAFCRFEGGELPTEAQWEYAAVAAGRPAEVIYPWGDDPPSCERAVYARALASDECVSQGEGPAPIDAPSDTTPLGIRHLAGNLEEHVRDSHVPFTDPCWTGAPSVDPVCIIPPVPECAADPASTECKLAGPSVHGVRGGSWFSRAGDLRAVRRDEAVSVTIQHPLLGFRCVYPAQ